MVSSLVDCYSIHVISARLPAMSILVIYHALNDPLVSSFGVIPQLRHCRVLIAGGVPSVTQRAASLVNSYALVVAVVKPA